MYILNDGVTVEQYHKKDSKLPWIVLYSGNLQNDEKIFHTKEDALIFINNDLGDIYDDEIFVKDRDILSDGKKYIYEEPCQFVFDTIKDDRVFLNDGDYIIRVKKKNNMIREDLIMVLSNKEFKILFKNMCFNQKNKQ